MSSAASGPAVLGLGTYRPTRRLTNADLVTHHTFWIGLYPGLTEDHIAFQVDMIRRFVAGARVASAA